MKKAAIIPVMALFSVILASCPDLTSESSTEGTFWTQNFVDKTFYQVKAERLYEGNKCEIWAQTGSGVTKAMAKDIANEYDTKIRGIIVKTFGSTFTDGSDILDYANWFAKRNNGKLTILLLDIKDGYVKDINDAYVAGYFYALDLFEKGPHEENGKIYYSNGRDMIYVDTDPGLKTQRTQAYSTFAHELQHLVNFITTVRIQRVNAQKQLLLTDTWVNEGLSAYAEYLYLGGHPEDKRVWLGDSRNTIKTGNNFFVWGNHMEDPESLAILDDYATVYLFFQWLYLQAGKQSHIFHDIVHSPHYDYQAVTDVAKEIDPAWANWETLLRTWLAANYYPQNSYGYTGDTELQNMIKIGPIFVTGNNISLYPGEGVYSIISGSVNPAAGGTNIRYAGLGSTGTINTSSPSYSGNVLLTFNANTNNSTAVPETGSLTGITPPPAASQTTTGNARQAGRRTAPYVIDAQDMLGRDQERFNLPVRR